MTITIYKHNLLSGNMLIFGFMLFSTMQDASIIMNPNWHKVSPLNLYYTCRKINA